MPRLACVDVPALPLQLLLIAHPEWRAAPVAVVAEDRPQAPLVYVTERARRLGILPGQRYSAALALSQDLRAGTVSSSDVEKSVVALAQRLRRFSPEIEPDGAHPGVFWLDASGLERIFPSLELWGGTLAADLDGAGYVVAVVVGFTRFGTYALARSSRGVQVFATHAGEVAAVRRVLLARLDLDPDVRDRLAALKVRTLGDFVDLPVSGIERRFGKQAARLHRLATGDLWDPLVAVAAPVENELELELEAPEANAERLLFVIKPQLDALLRALAARMEALTALDLRLRLDNGREQELRLTPAAPTLDAVQLLGLVRLRLETLRLSSGVVGLRLSAASTRAAPEQVRLFDERARGCAEAVERALARLKAELGDDVAVRARLRDAHLPGARFTWEPLARLPARLPAPRDVPRQPMIRRVYDAPLELPPRPRQEPDGWLLRGIAEGRVERLLGPYVVSGAWWQREVRRDYYYAQTSRGELLWIYYDRARRRYFLAGRVE